MTRPTPTDHVLPIFLQILEDKNVSVDDVLIVTAGGTHAPLAEAELQRKFSNHILERYNVVAHHAHAHLIHLGKTKAGTPIFVNEKMFASAIRIGIGGVYPHALAGFGGGAKLILGVCGFKTIANLHYRFPGSSLGGNTNNEFRNELNEIGKQLTIDALIGVVINEDCKVTRIFAGDLEASHMKAVEFCRKVFAVPAPNGADVVIANTYPFDTMILFSKKGWWPVKLSHEDSIRIIVDEFPAGVGFHGLHPMG